MLAEVRMRADYMKMMKGGVWYGWVSDKGG